MKRPRRSSGRSAKRVRFGSVFNAAAGAGSILWRGFKNRRSSQRASRARGRGGSKVGTRTKLRRVGGRDPGLAGNRSRTTIFRKGTPRMKKFLKNHMKFRDAANTAARLVSSVGFQSIFDSYFGLLRADLVTYATNVLNNKTTQLYVDKVKSFMEIKNNGNAGCKVWLYDLIARQDHSINPSTAWGTGEGTDQGAGAGTANSPYQTPFQSREFCVLWKVKKVTSLILAPGETHQHYVNYYPRLYISAERVNNEGASFLKGISHAQMLVVMGSLDNDSVTKTQISYGVATVNQFNSKEIWYMGAADNKVVSNVTNNLPSAFTISENVMEEFQDVVAAYANA